MEKRTESNFMKNSKATVDEIRDLKRNCDTTMSLITIYTALCYMFCIYFNITEMSS